MSSQVLPGWGSLRVILRFQPNDWLRKTGENSAKVLNRSAFLRSCGPCDNTRSRTRFRMHASDLRSIAPNLELGPHGWWTSRTLSKVAYPEEGNSTCFMVEDTSFWFQHRN